MKKISLIIITIAAIVIGMVLIFGVNESETEIQDMPNDIKNKTSQNKTGYDPFRPRLWITSGPFQIDRTEYYLGEKIFLRIGGLEDTDKGQIAFLRPLNATHYSVYMTIPFDGMKKPAFNYYIEPKLSKVRGICSATDLIGEWTVVFRGTEYPNLKFRVLNQTIPDEEDDYFVPVC